MKDSFKYKIEDNKIDYDELITNEHGNAFAYLFTDDGDTLEIEFNNGYVCIDFSQIDCIHLSENNIISIKYLMTEAKKYFDSKKFKDICLRDI